MTKRAMTRKEILTATIVFPDVPDGEFYSVCDDAILRELCRIGWVQLDTEPAARGRVYARLSVLGWRNIIALRGVQV